MTRRVLIPLALALAAPVASADDLTGADRLLCSAGNVTACFEDGTCALGTAAELNMPQFIEIDLVQKRLSTTKASGLNRASTIESMKRVEGAIVLQGLEKGRAYSFVIDEKTGLVTVAVATATKGVTAFGSCTPVPASR